MSESPVAAELPADAAQLAVDRRLPPDLARWSGVWHGWACFAAGCDVRVAIADLSAAGATVTYAAANRTQTVNDRAEGRFEAGELQLRLETGARLVLRLRADGDMEMSLWRPDTQLLSAGVLSRRPAAYVRRVERIETPWTEDGKPVRLEMVVHRPQGPGPFPTLVMNHGSTGIGNRPDWFGLTWTSPAVSAYFAERGWQIVYPQRRGRGGSDGRYDEGFTADRSRYACEAALSLPGAERALADLAVAMASIRERPDVDARRILLGGVSRGGILAMAYAGSGPGATRPRGQSEVLGVLNFVGGWMGTACADAAKINATLFTRGAGFDRATLWLYGERDPYFPIAHSRTSFEAFRAAGGQGIFEVFEPPHGMDGHGIAGFPRLWGAAVQEYLDRIRP